MSDKLEESEGCSNVSVLISVHNGVKTIERCLVSICEQTYKNITIVFVDDFSTDGTMRILEKIKDKYDSIPFVVLKNDSNIGLTKSLNRGLAQITSIFTARIDADDWWEPEKIERQVDFLRRNPQYGVVGTNYFNHFGNVIKHIKMPETADDIKQTIFWRNPFGHSTVMFRTDLIKSVGSYNPSVLYAQDYDLWVRLLPHTEFFNLQEFLCNRSLGVGVSVESQNEQMRLYLRVLCEYLPKYHRPLSEYFAMIEPILVLSTPGWVKKLKRRYIK